MFVKVFVLYSIFFLVSSCQSTLDIESFNDSVSERVGNYSFGLPDVFVVNSSESASLTLAYESGETYFQTYWVEQTSTGNSKCDVGVDDAYASNPVLTISNCTGNGRVTLSYGDSQSHQIHVSNDSISYDNSWEINVSNDGKSIFAIDRTDSRVLKVDIQTGVKTLLFPKQQVWVIRLQI